MKYILSLKKTLKKKKKNMLHTSCANNFNDMKSLIKIFFSCKKEKKV